jgi:hypothetical protein
MDLQKSGRGHSGIFHCDLRETMTTISVKNKTPQSSQ